MSVFVREDLEGLAHLESGASRIFRRWRGRAIRQAIPHAAGKAAAAAARRAIQDGAEEILIRQVDDLPTLLDALDLSATKVAFEVGPNTEEALAELRAAANRQGIKPSIIQGELGCDPVNDLIHGTTPAIDQEELLGDLEAAYAATADLPLCTPIAVHGIGIHQAGGDPETELGCAIATGIEYVRHLLSVDKLRADPDKATTSLCFRFPIDTQIYAEIAKLRAARLLWTKVASAFGAKTLETTIHAESSRRSLSTDDVHTNLIRTSIQGFAATLADCDSIVLAPFEATTDAADDRFAHSLTTNQQLLLRDESLLHRVQDPCGGAYAVEALTGQMAQRAWEIVRQIEGQGGIVKALLSGSVQQLAATSAQARRQKVQTRAKTLVGTNRYVDPRVSRTEVGIMDDAGGTEPGLPLPRPFPEFATDGAAFEQLRALVRRGEHRVQPILTSTTRRAHARFEFARDYLTAGGFTLEPTSTPGANLDGSKADYLVLCGEDSDFAAALTTLPGTPKIIAAPPDPSLGTDLTFIHAEDNTYETLRALYLRLYADEEETDV